MNMNINSVNFGAMAKPRVNIVSKVNGYVDYMLKEGGVQELAEKAAEQNNVIVKIAQSGDALFVNAGAVTGVIDMKKMKNGNEMGKNIVEVIRANSEVNAKGLDGIKKSAGFDFLKQIFK